MEKPRRAAFICLEHNIKFKLQSPAPPLPIFLEWLSQAKFSISKILTNPAERKFLGKVYVDLINELFLSMEDFCV